MLTNITKIDFDKKSIEFLKKEVPMPHGSRKRYDIDNLEEAKFKN